MTFLYELHSGWRYIVLLASILIVLYFIYALATKETSASAETRFLKIWAGLIDTQFLLGLLLYVLYLMEDIAYGALIGHLVVMLIATLFAHFPALYTRLNGTPSAPVRRWMGIVVPIVFLILVFGGVAAIDRGLFARGEAPALLWWLLP